MIQGEDQYHIGIVSNDIDRDKTKIFVIKIWEGNWFQIHEVKYARKLAKEKELRDVYGKKPLNQLRKLTNNPWMLKKIKLEYQNKMD